VQLGVALPTSGSWATPERILTLAQAAESGGYRSVWTFQRLLCAGPPEDPFPAAPGGRWPPVYRSVLDPLLPLAYVAAASRRLRLGVAVVNGPFFSPVVFAKQIVTLDILSGGRVDAGVGLGWSRAEYAAAGVPYAGRGRRLDEWLSCVDRLLRADPGEPVEFHGEYYSVPRSLLAPGPRQRPRPPLLVGGMADAALRRAAVLGDGWVSSSTDDLDGIRRRAELLRRLGAEHGRDDLRVVSRGVVRLRESDPAPARRRPLEGALRSVRADVGAFAAAGVDELFLDLNFDPEVGAPDADPDVSLSRALAVVNALAPHSGTGAG
jgi:probable F420-dependent oxidoreductase